MKQLHYIKLIIFFVILIVLVPLLSSYLSNMWGSKSEGKQGDLEIKFEENMTVKEFGSLNMLPEEALMKIFSLQSPDDQQKKISEIEIPKEKIIDKTKKALSIAGEYESRDWFKIPLKFALWIVFLTVAFIFLKKEMITSNVQKIFYLIAIALFGIVFGSDPSPMGTVKDAIVLFGTKRLVFPPRMIALTVFLIMVLVANKFICSWGCQAGTLQDFIFRLNRKDKGKQGIWKQYKVPFAVTNSIRILFFILIAVFAFSMMTDIVESIDPFKIYKPAAIGTIGWIFLAAILIASLFVYRPWCHLFCPFGLIGWIAEKISVFKIRVNYDTCVACESCVKACPSTVMNRVLKQDGITPDCFSCGTCIETCPTGSIHFRAGKRTLPPEGKFKSK